MLTIQNIQKLRGETLKPKMGVMWVIVSVDEIADGGYSYRINCKKVVGNQKKINKVEFALIRLETNKGEWKLYNNVKIMHHLVMNKDILMDRNMFLNYISEELKNLY